MPEGDYRGSQIEGATVCSRCGVVVAFDGRNKHDEWHDYIKTMEFVLTKVAVVTDAA